MDVLGLAGAGRAEGEEEKLVLLQGRTGGQRVSWGWEETVVFTHERRAWRILWRVPGLSRLHSRGNHR